MEGGNSSSSGQCVSQVIIREVLIVVRADCLATTT